MVSEEKIKQLLAKVLTCQLETNDMFGGLDVETIRKTYNGCGPDWLDEKFRDILTDCFERFEAAFLIHDCGYQFHKDGSRTEFHRENQRLRQNCRLIMLSEVPWYRFWKRWILASEIEVLFEAVELAGWSAWQK